jgi:hypothetical protein
MADPRESTEIAIAVRMAHEHNLRVLLYRHENGSYGHFIAGPPDAPGWKSVGYAQPYSVFGDVYFQYDPPFVSDKVGLL